MATAARHGVAVSVPGGHGVPSSALSVPPFFVVGCPRSGTTLMQQLLSRHPDIAVTPETHFLQRFVTRVAPAQNLRDDSQWAALLGRVEATPEFLESGVDVAVFRGWCAVGAREPQTVFTAWLSAFARAQGVRHVGEKTPNHLFEVKVLREWYPGTRFVVMVRDPRPVALSTGKVWWSAGSPRRDARAWRRYEAALNRAERDPLAPRDMLVVRYEDLVRRPQHELNRVFALLDVDPVAVEADSARPASGVDIEREHWKRRVAGPVEPGAADAWRTTMSASDVHAVETVTRRGMARRGYRPAGTGLSLAAGAAVEDVLSLLRRIQLTIRGRTGRGQL